MSRNDVNAVIVKILPFIVGTQFEQFVKSVLGYLLVFSEISKSCVYKNKCTISYIYRFISIKAIDEIKYTLLLVRRQCKEPVYSRNTAVMFIYSKFNHKIIIKRSCIFIGNFSGQPTQEISCHHLVISEKYSDVRLVHNIFQYIDRAFPTVDYIAYNKQFIAVREINLFQHCDESIIHTVQVAHNVGHIFSFLYKPKTR